MRMHKKGEVVTEFLMTYGWTILIVLGAIATLLYFNTDIKESELLGGGGRCSIDSPFECKDAGFKSNGTLHFKVKSTLDYPLDELKIKIEHISGSQICEEAVKSNVRPQEFISIDLACSTLESAKPLNARLSLTYTAKNQTGTAFGVLIIDAH